MMDRLRTAVISFQFLQVKEKRNMTCHTFGTQFRR